MPIRVDCSFQVETSLKEARTGGRIGFPPRPVGLFETFQGDSVLSPFAFKYNRLFVSEEKCSDRSACK